VYILAIIVRSTVTINDNRFEALRIISLHEHPRPLAAFEASGGITRACKKNRGFRLSTGPLLDTCAWNDLPTLSINPRCAQYSGLLFWQSAARRSVSSELEQLPVVTGGLSIRTPLHQRHDHFYNDATPILNQFSLAAIEG